MSEETICPDCKGKHWVSSLIEGEVCYFNCELGGECPSRPDMSDDERCARCAKKPCPTCNKDGKINAYKEPK